MSRLPALDPDTAPADTKGTLGAVKVALGVVPNLHRVAANSAAGLNAYVRMSTALGSGHLDAKARESIALTVAQANGCDYCLSAHSYLGAAAGLTPQDLADARQGEAGDPKTSAILDLSGRIVRERGNVGADAVAAAKAAGISDAEIVEIVGNVAVNIFTNYLNILADTEIDFPVVRAGELVHA